MSAYDQLPEAAFHPPHEEALLTPPPRASRWLTYTLAGFFAALIVWVSLGTVDVVVVADGRIVPTGQTTIIQAPNNGIVDAIRVREGQRVRAGELLVELDPTGTNADDDRTQRDIHMLEIMIARHAAAANNPSGSAPPFKAEWDPEIVAQQRDLLAADAAELASTLEDLSNQRNLLRERWAALTATGQSLAKRIGLQRQKLAHLRGLADDSHVPVMRVMDAEELLLRLETEASASNHQMREVASHIAAIDAEVDARYRAFIGSHRSQQATLERELQAKRRNLVKSTALQGRLRLFAPVDGIVEQLTVASPGAMVARGETIMKLVPLNGPVAAEVVIERKDMGTIKEGQSAQIKLAAHPNATRGVVPARVIRVDPDATAMGKRGPVYRASLAIDTQAFDPSSRISVSPGMRLVAEMHTGKRPILSFLTTPFTGSFQKTTGKQ